MRSVSSRQIGRPQSVIGSANFRGVRQWKSPKCDRGREFQGCPFRVGKLEGLKVLYGSRVLGVCDSGSTQSAIGVANNRVGRFRVGNWKTPKSQTFVWIYFLDPPDAAKND